MDETKSKLSKEEEKAINVLTLASYKSLMKPDPEYFKVLLDKVKILQENIKDAYEYEVMKKMAYDANISICQIDCSHCRYNCIDHDPVIDGKCIVEKTSLKMVIVILSYQKLMYLNLLKRIITI